jgi:hypothetical protein
MSLAQVPKARSNHCSFHIWQNAIHMCTVPFWDWLKILFRAVFPIFAWWKKVGGRELYALLPTPFRIAYVMNKVFLANFKGLSQHGQRVYFPKTLRASLFSVDLSNDSIFSKISVDHTFRYSYSQSTGNEKQVGRQEKWSVNLFKSSK